jgi:hypothetical protein
MSVAGSKKSNSSGISSQRREKLLKLKHREDLKGRLVTKFLAKYGNRRRASFIEQEVENALTGLPLTEENLRMLDERINAGTSVAPSGSYMSGISVKTGASQAASARPPKSEKSVSYMSGASKLSDGSRMRENEAQIEKESHVSSEVLPSDKDEWAVIMEYKQALYRQEEERKLERLRQQKEALKLELDRQIEEKKRKQEMEKVELQQYIETQDVNLKEFDSREQARIKLQKDKVMHEKMLRDKQLKDLKRMRRTQAKEELSTDVAMINRLQVEHREEIDALRKKKHDEMLQRRQMLDENMKNKRKQKEKEHQERIEDIEMQRAHERILDKIEEDRLNELKKREERIQGYMNSVGEAVLKQQQDANLEEDHRLMEYYGKTLEYDQEEQMRLKNRDKVQKAEMRKILQVQMEEKEARKRKERDLQVKQAMIWKKDCEEFDRITKEEKEKRDEIYKMYANELKGQIADKKTSQMHKMDYIERAFNKPLLKEVIDKTRPMVQH